MKQWQKSVVLGILVVLTLYFGWKAVRAYDRRSDGFTLAKITSDLAYNSEWDIPVSKRQVDLVNEVIKQPFYYLARGFQCYAFQSADGKYVLKFVRHQRLRMPEIAKYLPNIGFIESWKMKRVREGAVRANYLFLGLKTAFVEVPKETALLFVHINKTRGLFGKVTIIDRIGDQYSIPLDEYEFVLQLKANWIEPTIEKLMLEGRVNEAKARIDQIFQLLADCAHKGIQDQDGALIRKHNIGFYEDRAIYIDTGKLAKKEGIKRKSRFIKDLKRLRPLRKWLAQKYPELAAHFDKARIIAINNF